MIFHINAGRSGVFNGLFGNPVREKTVSPQYRAYFQKVMKTHPKEVAWLKKKMGEGGKMFCPGCGFDSPTCHIRVIEQELLMLDPMF